MSFGVRADLGREVALLQADGLAGLGRLYQRGHLGENGEGEEHAYGSQHAAVNLTDGRSDESADDEQEAGEEGDVKRRTVRRQMRLRALTDKSDTST